MSLSVAGVWQVDVWNQTVWADDVWREGEPAAPAPVFSGPIPDITLQQTVGVINIPGDSAAAFLTGPTGGTVTSDGEVLSVNHVGNYGGYIEIATTPGTTYRMTLEFVTPPSFYYYVEAYTGNGLFNTFVGNLEPMNNEVDPTGVVFGQFVATTTTTHIIFGSSSGTTYTFKNIKVEVPTLYDLGDYFTGATSYSIAPAIEPDWFFNTSTGVLSITTYTADLFGPFTVTATNDTGSTDSNAFNVNVTAILSAAEESFTGGWWFAYEQEMYRRKDEERRRRKLEEEAELLQDKIDRELIKELQAKEREKERIAELKRLAAIAERNIETIQRELSPEVLAAAESAILKGTFSAMEKFERELRRAKEEEEFLAVAFKMIMEQ
jgi:hypothetical protein